MRLEVIVIPVADVDRAKAFYQELKGRAAALGRVISSAGVKAAAGTASPTRPK